MKTENELIEEIKNITEIYLNIRILNDNCKYLKNPDTPKEFEIRYEYTVFQGIIYAMDRMVIIELCKLYGRRNDNYRIELFLKNVLNNFDSSEYACKISKQQIEDWQNALSSDLNLINLILKIQTLRDKYIAHKDRSPTEPINSFAPTMVEFQYLFDFVEKVIQYFEKHINNISPTFDKIGNVGKASDILHVLVEYKRLTKKEFDDECRKQDEQ